MKTPRKAWIACAALAAPIAIVLTLPASAQVTPPGGSTSQSISSSQAGGTPLVQLIDMVAKKSGKNFIVDPRVVGNATLIGIDPSKVTYSQLLSILQVHGFAAVETDGLVRIIPDAFGRAAPSPVIGANDKHPDAEIVTRVFRVKSVPASQLVPVLRALLPVSAHLAASPCTNELIMVDTYANVRRIESVVAQMDKGDPLTLPKCEPPGSQPKD